MLSTLASLLVSPGSAKGAFAKGQPMADGPHRVDAQWRPYLRHWTQMFENESFASLVYPKPDKGYLGLLKHAPFWRAYWAGFDTMMRKPTTPTSEACMKMVGHVVMQAAYKENMVVFHSVQGEMAAQTVLGCLAWSEHALKPSVLHWASSQKATSIVTNVNLLQKGYWENLGWWQATEGDSVLFLDEGQQAWAGEATIQEKVEQLHEGFLRYNLDARQQVFGLGHFFVNRPLEWYEPTQGVGLVEQLSTRLRDVLKPGVEVGLVALCSGCSTGGTQLAGMTHAMADDVRAMGAYFMEAGDGKTLDAMGIQTAEASMLVLMHEPTDALELYQAVQHFLHSKVAPQESLELPLLDM